MREASRFVSLFACLLWSWAAHALPVGWSDQNNEGGLTITYTETPSLISGHTDVRVNLQNQSVNTQAYNLFLGARQTVTVGTTYALQVMASDVSSGPVFQIGYHLFTAADAYITESATNYATNKHTEYSWSLPVPDIQLTHLTHQYLVPASPAVGKVQPRITVYDLQPGQTMSFNVVAAASAAVGSTGSGGTPPPGQTTMTSTLTLTSANNGQTFDNYSISTTSGNCVTMTGVTNVTFQNSRIGPCAGQGILIQSNSTGVNIYDSYIHVNNLAGGCCDTRDGVKVDGSNTVLIQGNVIAYNETNVRTQNGAHHVTVDGNFLLNPRGPFPRGQHFQTEASNNIAVTNNYGLSTQSGHLFNADQEDAINCYNSSTVNFSANYIQGGDSGSGCAFLNDDRCANTTINDNTAYQTGQCGIGIATGATVQVLRNKILSTNPISGAGNTGLYVWNQYASACNNVTVQNNQVSQVQSPIGCNPATSTCSFSSFWDGGGCGTISTSGNSFDNGSFGANSAPVYNSLKNSVPTAAPKIPPKPKNCIANSPYSNQTGFPACS